MKKHSERRKHCALAVVRRSEKFRLAAIPHRRTESAMAEPKSPPPAADPLPGGAGPPKFNQLEMATIYLHLQTRFGEDRCTQFRVIVGTVTDTTRPPATNTQIGPITIHCAAS